MEKSFDYLEAFNNLHICDYEPGTWYVRAQPISDSDIEEARRILESYESLYEEM